MTNKLSFYALFEEKFASKGERTGHPNLLIESKSQNGQDLFALMANNFKREGVFIEFGAYDGVIFSNTHLLEKHFEWKGILIDPIPAHYEAMKRNRECTLIHGAVTNEHKDSVLIEELPASELSRMLTKRKLFRKIHKVPSFTLEKVMKQHLDSSEIDFLSIDVEGNDLEILKSLDLNQFNVNVICVEHNFREGSSDILSHMDQAGYDLAYQEFSRNDYWFVLRK